MEINVAFTSPTSLRIDLASAKLKRKASTDVKINLFTDERVATEEFKVGQCDGVAISNPPNAPKVEASFRDELATVLSSGSTAEEVTVAKQALRDQRTVGRSQDASLLGLILAREEFGRTLAWDERLDAQLEGLTAADVNAVFRRHVSLDRLSIVKAGDFRDAGVSRR